jgi:mannose-6-phosphate isomerase-like protein (cupin superfamily)
MREEAMKRSVAVGALLGGFFAFVPVAVYAQSPPPDHVMVLPSEIKWTDLAALPPGAKLAVLQGPVNEAVPFIFRAKFPPNYKVPAHWHPVVEHLTVISGTFNMGTGDKLDTSKTMALTAGSIAIIQAKVPHFAWTTEETIVQVHGAGPTAFNFVNPDDDPKKMK